MVRRTAARGRFHRSLAARTTATGSDPPLDAWQARQLQVVTLDPLSAPASYLQAKLRQGRLRVSGFEVLDAESDQAPRSTLPERRD